MSINANKSLEFHIKSGDYFGTLATIISLFEQKFKLKNSERDDFKSIIDDLLYLQDGYIIVKK